jgi:hypothetical protein
MTGRRLRLFGRNSAVRGTDSLNSAVSSVPFPESERTVAPPPGLAPALTIDALGRKCPIPIIMLAEQIRDVPRGAIIAVLADDPAAYTDLPRGWALFIRRTV